MVSVKASLVEKILIFGWMSFLCVFGIIKFILGLVYIDGCPDMFLLPCYFLLGGVISLIPPVLTAYRNIYRKEGSAKVVDGLWWVLEKAFFLSLVLIVVGTIYILVSVTQVRVIGRLCTEAWLPPFGLFVMCADWFCYAVFFFTFCNVEYKEPVPPPGPIMPLYMHRHRQRPVRY